MEYPLPAPGRPPSLTAVSGTTFRKYGPFSRVTSEEIAFIRWLATTDPLHRARINLHQSDESLVHEMIIAMDSRSLAPPHYHIGKSESFHVLQGTLRVGVLDHDGLLLATLELRPDTSPIYRMNEDLNHFPVAVTDVVVFHETTNGPFRKGESLRLDNWAAAMDEAQLRQLRERIVSAPIAN